MKLRLGLLLWLAGGVAAWPQTVVEPLPAPAAAVSLDAPAEAAPLPAAAGIELPPVPGAFPGFEASYAPERAPILINAPNRLDGLSRALACERTLSRAGGDAQARELSSRFDLGQTASADGVLAPDPEGPPGYGSFAEQAMGYLNQRGPIRVFFAHAPGYGHQTSTLSMVRRLRELGFTGAIEAVYEERAELAQKLSRLLPEFDPSDPKDQFIPGLGMTLRSSAIHEGRRDRTTLGFTGGADLLSDSGVRWLRSDVFMRLAPFGWDVYQEELHLKQGVEPIPLRGLEKAATPYQPAALRADEAYLDGLPPTAMNAAKKRGLKTLLLAWDRHDTLAAYGLAFLKAHDIEGLLRSLALSMDRRPELYKGRGIVMTLLLDWDAEAGALALSLMRDPPLRKRVWIVSVEQPQLESVLRGMKAGDIVLVKTGAVPPPLFERFFKESTLPPTLEGKNAANLARLLGIPFLSYRAETYQGVLDKEEARDGEGELASGGLDLYDIFRGTVEKLADFITAAITPGSRLRGKFEAARIHREDQTRDKLLLALRQALPYLWTGTHTLGTPSPDKGCLNPKPKTVRGPRGGLFEAAGGGGPRPNPIAS